MTSSHPAIRRTLEEIHLLKCSVLPGELLVFLDDAAQWNELIEQYSLDPECEITGVQSPPATARFQIRLESSSNVWFEIELSHVHAPQESERMPRVAVKGDNLGRSEQERWQSLVARALSDVHDSEYPLYELISTHLLPELHAALDSSACADSEPERTAHDTANSVENSTRTSSPRYHALFVSHHLKSPHKRRSLSQWSHELSLSGFAKVGYPGVIYCEGAQEDVEDFVGRVKSMQWLALRLRFIESLPGSRNHSEDGEAQRRWAEFEKVGEVVEEMRRLGREPFIVEMGIGSAANAASESSR